MSHQRRPARRGRFASAALIRVLMAGFLCGPTLCAGAQPGEPFRFDLKIGSLPLDQALQEFARQSGVQILFFSQLTSGLRASGLVGEYTLTSAMERLLEGSGLSFRVINSTTVEIRRAESAMPPPPSSSTLSVSRPKPAPDPIDEVVVSGIAEQLVATRVPTPLKDIPQSIILVPREQIRQQSTFDLTDVMRRAAGITSRRGGSLLVDYFSRGFQVVSYHIDGGAALMPGATPGSPDLSEFEHVEVLRGSDALFSGNGNPGGTVSLVRKRPLATWQAEMNAEGGSWNERRVEIDVTGPLNDEGTLRARADAVYADKEYFYDTANFRRRRIFGVVEWDVMSDATLTLGGSYQWDNDVPWTAGIPSAQDGSAQPLSRTRSLTTDWAFMHVETPEVYVQYRQHFGEGWNARLNASSWEPKTSYVDPTVNTWLKPRVPGRPVQMAVDITSSPTVGRHHTLDFTVTGTLDWFGLRETVAFGADYTRWSERMDLVEYWTYGPALPDVQSFDPALFPDPLLEPLENSYGFAEWTHQYGAFASLRVELTEALSTTAGVRIATDSSGVAGDDGSVGYRNVTTPLLGLMYRLNDRYSWYASYADIYLSTPKSERPSGARMGPAHGVNLETGLKASWRDGALNGSLALYRIEQTNIAESISTEESYDPDRPYCCAISHTRHSRGAELDLHGELAPGWLLGGGYSYNVHSGPVPGSESEAELASPRHLVKAWTSVQLPGDLSRWTLGGDLEARSRTTARAMCFTPLCAGIKLTQPSYAVLDLRAGLRIDDHWQLSLRANNVFDKTYYETISAIDLAYFYGEPRNFALRLDSRF